ncbi:MAG: 16S rRNA (guanine(527)-N(7))-methyltransferase RsmG [Desulfobacterales bacterium]|jgi:16S rRNA (guanine527-N7)-methyltransferase
MMIGTEEWKALIRTGAEQLGVTLSRSAVDQFAVHARELMLWNSKINLTAITEPLAVAVKHYIDAVAPADLIPPQARLLDIGSGGGFPGIPLKIMKPSLSLTIIDAARKKVSFLNQAGRTLHLKDYRVRHMRIEKLRNAEDVLRSRQANDPAKTPWSGGSPFANDLGTFDVVISRALAPLDEYLMLALPFIAEKGLILALKGRISETELATARHVLTVIRSAWPTPSPEHELTVRRYRLPVFESERCIVAVNL